MSKYDQGIRRVSKRSEIDGEHPSFMQEKQYSFSKASQKEPKQTDDKSKKDEKSEILDFLGDSTDQQGDQTKPLKVEHNVKLLEIDQIGEEREAEGETQRVLDNKTDNVIPNYEESNKNQKPSEQLTQFFKSAPKAVSLQAKEKAQKMWSILKEKVKNKQKVDDDSEKKEDEFGHAGKRNKSGRRLSQQQDFGNISEIHERKYARMEDESAQEDEFSSLLNNNNNNLQAEINNAAHSNQNLNNSEIHQQYYSSTKKQEEPNENNHDHIYSDLDNRNFIKPKSAEGKEVSRKDDREKSASARDHKQTEQQLRLEEARRKKQQLEDEIRALEGEIVQYSGKSKSKKQRKKSVLSNDSYTKEGNKENNKEEEEQDETQRKIQKDRFGIAADREASENALNLVKKMNRMRKEKDVKSQQEKQQFGKLIQEDIKESSERHKEIKQKLVNEKKEKILEKIQQIRMRSEERKFLNKQSNSVIKDIQLDLKYNDPNEKFKQEYEIPELERRKKQLADKRQLYKPIGIDEIREHAKKHDDEIKLRKLQARTNVLAEYGANLELQNLPKSHALHKVLEEDKMFKMKDVFDLQKKKEQSERRKEYAKLVKEVHVPRVKPQQIFEDENEEEGSVPRQINPIQRILPPRKPKPVINYPPLKKKNPPQLNEGGRSTSNLNLSPRSGHSGVLRNPQASSKNNLRARPLPNERSITPNDDGNGQQNPYENEFQQYDQQEDNFESNKSHQQQTAKSSYTAYSSASKQHKLKQDAPYISEEFSKPVHKKSGADYISGLRKQREENEKKGKKTKIEDWEKYKYDPSLSQKDKYAFILQSAARLEHNAKMKEMGNGSDLNQQEQANNLYIDSIKAKLALLDNLN